MREGCPIPGAEDPLGNKCGKAAEAKEPLLPSGVNVVQRGKWKAKRLAKWDDLTEWKLLIARCSPYMEQLREKFGGMDI